MCVRLFSCLALCLGVSGVRAGTAETSRARDLMRSLPVRFEPNLGQWNGNVKFFARTGDSHLLLTSRDAVLSASGHVVGLSLLHANPSPRVEGLDPQTARANYFVGADRDRWRTGVTQYGRVRYSAVYPGIDLIYYGSQSRLEYDLVLHPGADPRRIRLKFRGADDLRINSAGDLLLTAGDAEVVQQKPVIYQQTASGERRLVEGRYRLLGANTVGVELAAYDRSRTLTIDPVLVYSSLLGGGATDSVTAVKTDRAGMVWITGYTTSTDLPGNDSSLQAANGGGQNIFLAKINPKADPGSSLVYFTYIGGSGTDIPNAMAIDSAGYIYLAGSTTSTNFPVSGVVTQKNVAGGTDAFMLKFDPTASGSDQLFYSTPFGGADADEARGIAVDAAGKIYVTGTTRSTDFPLTGSAYAGVLYGPQDAFVVRYDLTTSPTLVYSTYLGGELRDYGQSIAVTPNGTVYVAGSTESAQFPQAGAQYRGTLAGFLDIWVAQMDLTKSGVDSLLYSTYLGGSDLDEVSAIALDPTGKLLLTGYTMSPDFPVTGDAARGALAGNADAFIVRLDFTRPQAGFVNYATYLGGVSGDAGYGIASDAAGNIYVTGYSLSSNFPVTDDALVKSGGAGTEVFVAKLTAAGSLVYSTYLGAAGQHVGYGIAVAADGTIYVGGATNVQDIFITANATQNGFGGGVSDGFLIAVGP